MALHLAVDNTTSLRIISTLLDEAYLIEPLPKDIVALLIALADEDIADISAVFGASG